MPTTTPTVKRIEPGIYFGLDEDQYHADLALGSSDVRNNLLSPCDYWWGSPLNPDREDDENDDTPAKIRGKAMHKLVLEGEAAFDKIYAKGAEHTKDMTSSEKGAATKAANAKAAATGRVALPAKDYNRIAIAAAMITKNPKLAGAFTGGIPEVSIFWDRVVEAPNGLSFTVRCKARIDYLKPRGMGDLKSVTNIKKIEFKRACREAIANMRYDMQAAHYMNGRGQLPKLVAEGRVFGDHDKELLKRIAEAKTFAFQFVFFQASKAPVTYSPILSPANPMIELADQHVEAALYNFDQHLKQFGENSIWLMLDEPRELAMEEMPGWHARL